MTHSTKYQAAITAAVVTRNVPRATAHVQNHNRIVAAIAQLAHPCKCHSNPELGREAYPTRSKRKVSVTKGMDTRRAASRTVGDKSSKRGCDDSSWVVSVRVNEVECIFCGNVKRRRPVMSASTNGISAKRRKLVENVSGLV